MCFKIELFLKSKRYIVLNLSCLPNSSVTKTFLFKVSASEFKENECFKQNKRAVAIKVTEVSQALPSHEHLMHGPVGPCNSLVSTCRCLQRSSSCPQLGLSLCPPAAQLPERVVGWCLSARPSHDGLHGESPGAPSTPAHKGISTLALSYATVKFFRDNPHSSQGSQTVFIFTSLPPTVYFMRRVTGFRVGLTIYLIYLKILSSAGSVGFKDCKPQVWPRHICCLEN